MPIRQWPVLSEQASRLVGPPDIAHIKAIHKCPFISPGEAAGALDPIHRADVEALAYGAAPALSSADAAIVPSHKAPGQVTSLDGPIVEASGDHAIDTISYDAARHGIRLDRSDIDAVGHSTVHPPDDAADPVPADYLAGIDTIRYSAGARTSDPADHYAVTCVQNA